MEEDISCYTNFEKARMAVLISENVEFEGIKLSILTGPLSND